MANLDIPDRSSILEAVDEYSLYCFYADQIITPGKAILSPIPRENGRTDSVPSFVIFESYHPVFEYMWKDHALGKSGNIFDLIRLIHDPNLAEFEVYSIIINDFGLDDMFFASTTKRDKVILFEKQSQTYAQIRIHSIPFTPIGQAYWQQFQIPPELLQFYKTTQIDCYWSFEGQEAPFFAPDPTFAYNVGGYYQIYSPHAERKNKFRNNLPENYFFGYLQLPPNGETLVIDKSAKDSIFCRRLGYWAVCGKSETTMIPDCKMKELKDRFRNVFLTLDPDEAGRKQTEKYMEQYPWLKPRFLSEAKDKTDLCKKVGFEQASNIIKNLLQ